MNLAKLKHVIAVDRKGSFTAAAAAVNLTQSAVTKSVADIERSLGFALFERRAKRVLTTEQGREFIDRAARLVGDFEQLIEDAQGHAQTQERLIRVALSPQSIEGLANTAVSSFMAANPHTRLHLISTGAEAGTRMLRRGDVDILVGFEAELAVDPGFRIARLGELRAHLFARRDHPLAGLATVPDAALRQYPVIVPDVISPYISQLTRRLGGGDDFRNIHIIENFQMVKKAVLESDCIALVSRGYAATRSFSRQLVVIDPGFLPAAEVSYAIRRSWTPGRTARAFIHALGEHPPI